MTETPIHSYEQLVELLVRDGVTHQASPSERGVLIPTRLGGQEAAMILRWSPDQGALHVVQTLPITIPPPARAAVARLMTLLNHTLAMPGLTMDLDRGAMVYRAILPILRVAPPLVEDLRGLTSLLLRNAGDLIPVLVSVVHGVAPEAALSDWQASQRAAVRDV